MSEFPGTTVRHFRLGDVGGFRRDLIEPPCFTGAASRLPQCRYPLQQVRIAVLTSTMVG